MDGFDKFALYMALGTAFAFSAVMLLMFWLFRL